VSLTIIGQQVIIGQCISAHKQKYTAAHYPRSSSEWFSQENKKEEMSIRNSQTKLVKSQAIVTASQWWKGPSRKK
jgi:hypothetical protein